MPEKLIEMARARGLDGVCLSEHDRWWPGEDLAALQERTGFPVFSAVELTTDIGHLLAFGLGQHHGPLATAEAAAAAARADGAVLYLAHPARDGLLRVDHRLLETVQGVEGINGSDSRLQNVASSGLAKGFPLPGIGGSDTHSPAEVGRAATRFHAPIASQADLVAALKAGAYEAVWVE